MLTLLFRCEKRALAAFLAELANRGHHITEEPGVTAPCLAALVALTDLLLEYYFRFEHLFGLLLNDSWLTPMMIVFLTFGSCGSKPFIYGDVPMRTKLCCAGKHRRLRQLSSDNFRS